MPRTNWKTLAQYEAVLPSNELAKQFNYLVVPMIQRTIVNTRESRALARLRDTLLPKLLSGEIRVAEAEKKMRSRVVSPATHSIGDVA